MCWLAGAAGAHASAFGAKLAVRLLLVVGGAGVPLSLPVGVAVPVPVTVPEGEPVAGGVALAETEGEAAREGVVEGVAPT